MPAARVVWAGIVGLYDETLPFVGANLGWVVANLPLYLVLLALLVPLAGPPEAGGAAVVVPSALAAWLLLLLPTPGGLALGELARVTAAQEAPRLGAFWQTLGRTWRLALVLFLVSVLGIVVLSVNLYFYLAQVRGWPRLLTIVWLYLLLFWLGMQLYLVPLSLRLSPPRIVDLYRRAALLTLGHAPYTLVLTAIIGLVGLLSVAFFPLYPLLGGAFVALVQAYAFRELRRRHGDLAEASGEAEQS